MLLMRLRQAWRPDRRACCGRNNAAASVLIDVSFFLSFSPENAAAKIKSKKVAGRGRPHRLGLRSERGEVEPAVEPRCKSDRTVIWTDRMTWLRSKCPDSLLLFVFFQSSSVFFQSSFPCRPFFFLNQLLGDSKKRSSVLQRTAQMPRRLFMSITVTNA